MNKLLEAIITMFVIYIIVNVTLLDNLGAVLHL